MALNPQHSALHGTALGLIAEVLGPDKRFDPAYEHDGLATPNRVLTQARPRLAHQAAKAQPLSDGLLSVKPVSEILGARS